MIDEQPIAPTPGAQPERVPFWGYADVFLIAGLALPCMFLGWALVHLAVSITHLHVSSGVEAAPEMLIGYGLLFTALMVIFRLQYDRPFWRSLGWTWSGVPIAGCVLYGFATTILMGIVAWLIHTPPTSGPMVDMLKDRTTLIVLAIFGTTAAPVTDSRRVWRGKDAKSG